MNLGPASIPDRNLQPIEQLSIINENEEDNIFYNCSECSSLIEITSINENNNIIEYKCLNKNNKEHNKIMQIKEYLEKMSKFKEKNINIDYCSSHNNNKYMSFCFNCNKHL